MCRQFFCRTSESCGNESPSCLWSRCWWLWKAKLYSSYFFKISTCFHNWYVLFIAITFFLDHLMEFIFDIFVYLFPSFGLANYVWKSKWHISNFGCYNHRIGYWRSLSWLRHGKQAWTHFCGTTLLSFFHIFMKFHAFFSVFASGIDH